MRKVVSFTLLSRGDSDLRVKRSDGWTVAKLHSSHQHRREFAKLHSSLEIADNAPLHASQPKMSAAASSPAPVNKLTVHYDKARAEYEEAQGGSLIKVYIHIRTCTYMPQLTRSWTKFATLQSFAMGA